MSMDNYISIWKGKAGLFRGYDLSASCTYDKRKIDRMKPDFIARTIEEAIQMGQAEISEYGIRFENLVDVKRHC